MPSFENLSPKLTGKILGYLSYAEISKLRGVSINLHHAAVSRLNSAFLELGPRLITKYTEYLILTKTEDQRYFIQRYCTRQPYYLSCIEIMKKKIRSRITESIYKAYTSCKSGDAIFRGRFLKLLGSEHAILLALCRSYITNGKGCFSPGEILDLFHELQDNNYPTAGMQQDENKKLSRLVLLIDQYLDWLEKYRISYEEQCSWYGTCIVDLLDSYLSSSYNLVATHDGPLVKLSGRYMIRGQSEIPPKISEPLGGPITQKELLQVLQYVRKHARWSNFVNSFRNEPENYPELEEDSVSLPMKEKKTTTKIIEKLQEEVITTNTKEEGYQRTYRRNNSKNFNNSYDENVESLTVMVNLNCDRSCGPIRLRGGFEEMNSWRKEIEFLTREINSNYPSLAKNLSILSNNKDSNLSLKSKLQQLRSITESAAAATRKSASADTPKTLLHHKYVFNLEIKSIHPAKIDANISAGEKFGETMLHISHTPEHIFGAQTECSLY